MKTALLLIAHGSRRPQANADLSDLAEQLRGRIDCEIVQVSYLELAQPDVVEGGSRCAQAGAQAVVLLPYFLAAGTHVRRDLTGLRDRLAGMFPEVDFRLAEPLGPHPYLAEIVIDRFRAASADQEPGTE